MSTADRRARITAQYDQVRAEGEDLVKDDDLVAAAVAWREATTVFVRVLAANGVPRDGFLGALLPLTAELAIELRDEGT